MHIFSSQPPPAQSMVQALELLYALGGENIMLCFIHSYVTGVMKKILHLYLVIGWTLIKLTFENCALRKRKCSLDWWKLFVGVFLKCTSVSSEFTFPLVISDR